MPGMYKTCSVCGKVHPRDMVCKRKRTFDGGDERRLRSKWAWTEKSRQVREQAHHLCEVCMDKGQITYDGIEVHHITKVSEDASALLVDDNLICLCQEHHKQADRNEIDREYLRELAKKRQEKQTGDITAIA